MSADFIDMGELNTEEFVFKVATIDNTFKDVHTHHCCALHGCKYGKDDECAVVTGKSLQVNSCEFCPSQAQIDEKIAELIELKTKVDALVQRGIEFSYPSDYFD